MRKQYWCKKHRQFTLSDCGGCLEISDDIYAHYLAAGWLRRRIIILFLNYIANGYVGEIGELYGVRFQVSNDDNE